MDKEKQLELLKSDLIIAQNKLNDIQKNFIKLSEELKEEKKANETWKPYKDGYYLGSTGKIFLIEGSLANPHNGFRTEKLAELRQKQRQAEDELFNIWESLVGDWRPDYNNKEYKYFCWYDLQNKILSCSLTNSVVQIPSYRIFPREKLAMKQYEMASEHAKAYIRGEF